MVERSRGFTEWPEGSKTTIVEGIKKAAGGRSIDELERLRDEVLLELVQIRMKQAESVEAPAH